MIQLKTGQLRDPQFLAITRRIASSKMGFGSARRLSKIFKALQAELDIVNELFPKIAKEHLIESKEAPGNYVGIKEGEEHQKAIDEFMMSPVEINQPRITSQELFHVELSPDDLDILEGLVDVSDT